MTLKYRYKIELIMRLNYISAQTLDASPKFPQAAEQNTIVQKQPYLIYIETLKQKPEISLVWSAAKLTKGALKCCAN